MRKSQDALSKARRVDVKATKREAIEELLFAEPPEELSAMEMQHLVDVVRAESQVTHFLSEEEGFVQCHHLFHTTHLFS